VGVGKKSVRQPVDHAAADIILKRIASGEWAEGTLLPSVRRLAKDMGVGLTTVIRALHRTARRRLVKVQRRQGVVLLEGASARARELMARRSRQVRSRRVAVLLPERHLPLNGNPGYELLVNAISRAAERKGISITVCGCPTKRQRLFAVCLLRDGIEAATCVAFDQAYMSMPVILWENGLPTTMFNRHIEDPPTPSVHIEDYGSTIDLAERLWRLGHHNMCMVTHQSGYSGQKGGRVSGWIDFLVSHNLVGECTLPLYVIPASGAIPEYGAMFADAVKGPCRPTAMVFAHSPWAVKFLLDPRFRTIRIPDELSVVSFEGFPKTLLPASVPEITTLAVNYERVGECMVEQLVQLLRGGEHPPDIRVPLYLQLTESIGTPSNTGPLAL
jgi:DNA-binding LacI/PurR family transcriptional regulator